MGINYGRTSFEVASCSKNIEEFERKKLGRCLEEAPPRGSPRDLTYRPYSDVVPKASLNVLSPSAPQETKDEFPALRALETPVLYAHREVFVVRQMLLVWPNHERRSGPSSRALRDHGDRQSRYESNR